jgi:hypothetical protein
MTVHARVRATGELCHTGATSTDRGESATTHRHSDWSGIPAWRPPAFFFLILAAMLLFYLLGVEGMKQWFFHRFAAE